MPSRHRDCPCIVGVSVAGIVVMLTVAIALYVTSSIREPGVFRDMVRDQRIIKWPNWPALCSTYSIQTYPTPAAAAYFDLWHFPEIDPTDRIYKSKKDQCLIGTGSLSARKYEAYFFHFLRTTSVDATVTVTSKNLSKIGSLEILFFHTSKFNDWSNNVSPSKFQSSDQGCDVNSKANCYSKTKHFNITTTDNYVLAVYNNDRNPSSPDVKYRIDFKIRRAEYSDVKNLTGIRIASVQQQKDVSGVHGWYILTLPEDNTTPSQVGGPLESTEIKVVCTQTNIYVFFALFGLVPGVLLMVIGCVTWRIQFRVNEDYYDDEERRRLVRTVSHDNTSQYAGARTYT